MEEQAETERVFDLEVPRFGQGSSDSVERNQAHKICSSPEHGHGNTRGFTHCFLQPSAMSFAILAVFKCFLWLTVIASALQTPVASVQKQALSKTTTTSAPWPCAGCLHFGVAFCRFPPPTLEHSEHFGPFRSVWRMTLQAAYELLAPFPQEALDNIWL